MPFKLTFGSLIMLAVILAMTGCRSSAPVRSGTGGNTTPQIDENTRAIFESTGDIGEGTTQDFTRAATSAAFKEISTELAKQSGLAPKPLGSVKGGVCFAFEQKQAEKLLAEKQAPYLQKGCYIFRCVQNFGTGGCRDLVGLLPTTDKYAVIDAVQTNGVNYDTLTPAIISWLKKLEKEQPFILTGVGIDFLEGKFTTPIKDPNGLAQRIYKFCPDIVDQGDGSVSALADDLQKNRTLYFWWD